MGSELKAMSQQNYYEHQMYNQQEKQQELQKQHIKMQKEYEEQQL